MRSHTPERGWNADANAAVAGGRRFGSGWRGAGRVRDGGDGATNSAAPAGVGSGGCGGPSGARPRCAGRRGAARPAGSAGTALVQGPPDGTRGDGHGAL